jgi:hypothetical protein
MEEFKYALGKQKNTHNKSIKHRKQTPKTVKTQEIQRNTNIITMAMMLDKCEPNPRKGQDTY